MTEDADLKVNLIKGNSAHITDSKVTGIADGYDVFGGGATQDKNGEGDAGYAGGFVGHNDEGVLTGDEMVYADVSARARRIRPARSPASPTTARTGGSTTWENIEQNNTYHVYRGRRSRGCRGHPELVGNMNVSKGAYDTGVPRK